MSGKSLISHNKAYARNERLGPALEIARLAGAIEA